MKRTLAKNAIFNVLYKLLSVVFPLISAAYVSHILLSDGIGKVAYAQNIAQYFVLLAPLGLPDYGTKQIAKNRSANINQTFSELFIINAISTSLWIVIYYVIVIGFPYFSNNRSLFCITGLAIIFNYLNVDWYFKGIEEFGYIALRSLIVKVLSLIALLLLVRNKDDYLIYALIYVLAIGGNNLFNIARVIHKGTRFQFHSIHPKEHLKPVVTLLLNSLAIELYTLFDTSMLGFLCTDETVGYYTNAIKLVRVWVTLVTAISGVLLPRFSVIRMNNNTEEIDRLISSVFKIMLYIVIPSTVGMCVLSDSIISFVFGESFAPAGSTLKIASLLILVMGFSYLFGTQVLITFNYEKQLLRCSLVGAISNICMNLFLIPILLQNGAIIASVLSETAVTVMTYIFARRYIKLKVHSSDLIIPLTSSMIMGALVLFINSFKMEPIKTVFVGVTTGVLSYCTFIFLLNKDLRAVVRKQAKNVLQKARN